MSIERMQDEGVLPADDQLGSLLSKAGEIQASLDDEKADRGELKAQLAAVKADIDAWQAAKNKDAEKAAMAAEIKAMVDATLADTRTASKANIVGGSPQAPVHTESFFSTLAFARSSRLSGSVKAQMEAEEALESEFGSLWAPVNPYSKATVGDSDAAGGYLVPNNVVADINLQASPGRSVVDLFTVIDGVNGSAVDIPWEQSADSRAVIAAPGATKENSNFIVNNYTATLYTLARIFDVGNQLLRHSQGAAERLVRSKLARAFALGEDYYAIQGSGSSEPMGLLTAIGTSGTYVTTFSSPSYSTVAGNWASAAAAMAAAIAQRGAEPNGMVMNSSDYWLALASGADAAGFYVDPNGGGLSFSGASAGQTGVGPWGIRLRHSPNMPSDSAVVGDFAAAQFYRGQGYRVDVSSEAGDRWDKNLTGFRGEEEIAFDARPFVYTGYFQRVTNIKP